MLLKKTAGYIYMVLTLCFMSAGCTDMPFTPFKTGSITGQVLDQETQLGIPGVFITTSPAIGSTLTNDYGNFSFDNIPEELYTINALKTGYDNETQSVQIKEGYSPHLTILLEKTSTLTGTIKGTVYSQDDTPLARVCISTQPGTHIILTGTDGKYELTEAPEGAYKITAVKPGYNDLTLELTVRKNRETVADFILERKSE